MKAEVKAHRVTKRDERVEVIARDVVACRAHELPADLAEAVRTARMDPSLDYLNALIAK